jgi:uncharacterized protein YaiI (UPF0178 family)
MKILVDADACPVIKIIEAIAKERQIELVLVIDTSHILDSNYAKVITVSKGADAVDFALINHTNQGDIVVTQDYGVAAMALGKKAYAIHQSGKWFTNENINQMLMERHIAKEARRKSSKHHVKGPRKRTSEDDTRFKESFYKLIDTAQKLN